jgi:hypothetical protein
VGKKPIGKHGLYMAQMLWISWVFATSQLFMAIAARMVIEAPGSVLRSRSEVYRLGIPVDLIGELNFVIVVRTLPHGESRTWKQCLGR